MKTSKVFTAGLIVFIAGCASVGGGGGNPAIGTWDAISTSQLGENAQVLVVNEDMTGVVRNQGAIETAMQNAAFADGELTFDVTFMIQGQNLAAKFVGTVDGDAIVGEYQTQFGNASVKGTRAL
jgi:hypothetical protein|tara:strand:- start:1724 stop:2095 length:372 start_codon:yes stop_codon:yes gene_type:complete